MNGLFSASPFYELESEDEFNMAKFCRKCGTKLDQATGLCPKCDVEKSAKLSEESGKEKEKQEVIAPQNPLSKKEFKKQNKAAKRNKKKEKRAQWSTGKKVRRFLLKFVLASLLLALLSTCVVAALAYFGIVDITELLPVFDKFVVANQNTIKDFDNGDTVSTPAQKNVAYDANTNMLYFNNQLIVYTFSNLGKDNANKLAELVGGKIVGDINGGINALQIRVKPSTLNELESMAIQLMESEDVLYAGYDYPMQLLPAEIDSNPWSIESINPEVDRGNEGNPSGNDWWAEAIGAYTAWEYSENCQPIKIGILDSGFDAKHEDLIGRISFLPEYEKNSEDNHGTHVAGIIGANNNAVGIRGIADSADLICVDWSPTESINYLSTGEYIEIIKQLVEADVKVINNSWGNYFASKDGYTQGVYGPDNGIKYLFEYFAIHSTGAYDSYVDYCEAFSKRTGLDCILMMLQLILNGNDDFLIVQAAGNGYDNGGLGVDAHYSACFCAINIDIYNILSESVRATLAQKGIDYNDISERILIVGAVENKHSKDGNYIMSQYSNFGKNVDICAPGGKGGNNPGKNVYSTLMSNNYGELSGTSMAAPMVTGSAAFIWSLNPKLTAPEVRSILLENTIVQAYGVGSGSQYCYPMVNVGAATKAVIENAKNDQPDKSNISVGAIEFNGHHYKLYDESLTWQEAKDACEQAGGHLVTISSQEEQDFISGHIQGAAKRSYWIGLSDEEENDNWTWVTGEPLSYSNWAINEPNHGYGGSEHYVAIVSYDTFYNYEVLFGQWNDHVNNDVELYQFGYICEWDDSATLPGEQPTQDPVHTTESDMVGGYCGAELEGKNVSWKLEDGILTISGQGDMLDLNSYDDQPWANVRFDATLIIVEEGITSIGNECFRNLSNVTNVSLPTSLVRIGKDAFLYTSLKQINLPDNLENIGESAFTNLTSLTGELFLPNSITEIGKAAFYGCSGLTGTLKLPASLSTIGEMAFSRCSGFSGELTIPAGVETIPSDAFADCYQLSGALTLSEGVKVVEQNAFHGCSQIETINLPSTIERIESRAFSQCSSVQSIMCHGSLDTISRRNLPYGIKIEYVD